MNIKLKRLTLHNFKGIKDFTFAIDGKNASIYGENGTGKTTLVDAFLWVLFDKDSTNRSKFGIKPHENGVEVHHLETEVECILIVDGTEMIFKKQLTEKWTRKRGQEEQEYSGNETSYWVDEIPVKAGEYQSKINTLIHEDIFKLITNPLYFSTALDWQKRRNTLMEISGYYVTDAAVIASDSKLSKLTEILGKKSAEDYKKVVAERLRALNKEREGITPRIDENVKSLPKESNIDYASVEKEKAELEVRRQDIDKQLGTATAALQEFKSKQDELLKLYDNIHTIKCLINSKFSTKRNKFLEEKNQLSQLKSENVYFIGATTIKINTKTSEIKELEEKSQVLRDEWHICDKRKFEGDTICPTCNQLFPAEMIEQAKENFEQNKKKTKQEINLKGIKTKNEILILQTQISDLKNEIKDKDSENEQIDSKLAEIEIALALPTCTPDYDSDLDYVKLKTEIEKLESEIKNQNSEDKSPLAEEKQKIADRLNALNKQLFERRHVEEVKKRIEELRTKEKELGVQISELEGHRFLIDEFTRAKVNILEDSINKLFSTVKFKLFKNNINGGLDDCCEALIDGVPYSDANHAAQVNAGLDIINTLGKHYKTTAPIFFDNRESVSELIPTDSQIINLVVSPEDKELRVAIDE